VLIWNSIINNFLRKNNSERKRRVSLCFTGYILNILIQYTYNIQHFLPQFMPINIKLFDTRQYNKEIIVVTNYQ